MKLLFLLAVLLPYGWFSARFDRLSTPTYRLLRYYRYLVGYYLLLGLLAMHKADLWHHELQVLIQHCP